MVPDRLKEPTYIYKRALGGYLIELQGEVFKYQRLLTNGGINQELMQELQNFAMLRLSFSGPTGFKERPLEEKIHIFKKFLNRPLRVCGMVRNASLKSQKSAP